MKRVLLGLAVGAVVGYAIRKLQDDGQFDCICDCTDKFLSKSKRNLKNVADVAKNEAEYLKDRVEDMVGKK
ncbi:MULTISPECIES: hypothetical protein [unclassified Dysgonomonas]|uniref:hypothetical protein n=1 Tax=unclassified Dysgonomonas TaxID=2630389 RepID=UPI0013EBF7F6|nr:MULTISPECIES: hypothetical protein [unclassified Dysgonomonas]